MNVTKLGEEHPGVGAHTSLFSDWGMVKPSTGEKAVTGSYEP